MYFSSILHSYFVKAYLLLFIVDGKFEACFFTKANVFNNFFANKYNILDNGSFLPDFQVKCNTYTNKVFLPRDEVYKIITNLNPNKAHGSDGISIKMIQLCKQSIVTPSIIIFKTALRTGVFPHPWKKGNIVPVHKNESKNLIKNYRPISVLPIFGKIFEKIIYNSLYKDINHNNILSDNQASFRRGNSSISQL